MRNDGHVLVTVPARGGSKGLRRKNLKSVSGVSLVGRAVLRARAFLARTDLYNRATLLVDTDDPEIASEAGRWGAPPPFLRPVELARDETSSLDTVLHSLGRLEVDVESIVLLQPTSPLCRYRDIVSCWEVYDPGQCPSVVSLVELDHSVDLTVHLGKDERIDWALGEAPASSRRQDYRTPYRPNGAVYINSSEVLRDRRAFVVEGLTRGVAMPWSYSLDVDTEADLGMVRGLAAAASPPAWPGADSGTLVHLEEAPSVAAASDIEIIPGKPTFLQTAEAVLSRLSASDVSVAVEFSERSGDTEAYLAQIEPLRSIMGVPVCWVSRTPSGTEAARAVAYGASALAGPASSDLVQIAQELRRSIASLTSTQAR